MTDHAGFPLKMTKLRVFLRERCKSLSRFEILMRKALTNAEMGDTGDAITEDEIIFSQQLVQGMSTATIGGPLLMRPPQSTK